MLVNSLICINLLSLLSKRRYFLLLRVDLNKLFYASALLFADKDVYTSIYLVAVIDRLLTLESLIGLTYIKLKCVSFIERHQGDIDKVLWPLSIYIMFIGSLCKQ